MPPPGRHSFGVFSNELLSAGLRGVGLQYGLLNQTPTGLDHLEVWPFLACFAQFLLVAFEELAFDRMKVRLGSFRHLS